MSEDNRTDSPPPFRGEEGSPASGVRRIRCPTREERTEGEAVPRVPTVIANLEDTLLLSLPSTPVSS